MSTDKKQFRKDIESRIEKAIGNLAQAADKKFKKLLKKASKLLADGLHHHKPKSAGIKKTVVPAKPAAKKSVAKKPVPKNAEAKK